MRVPALKFGVLVAVIAGVGSAQTTLHTTTTLVAVPTLVQTSGKEPVFSLTAEDFVLTDNGVPQKVTLEEETKRAAVAGGADADGRNCPGPVWELREP